MSSQHKLMTAAEFLKFLAENKGNLLLNRGSITVRGGVHLRPGDLGQAVESLHLSNCTFLEGLYLSEFKRLKSLRIENCTFVSGALDVGQCNFERLSVSSGDTVSRLHIWCCEATEGIWLGNLKIERELEISASKIVGELMVAGCTFGDFRLRGNNGASVLDGAVVDETYRDDERRPDAAHREKLVESAMVAAAQLRYLNVPTHISSTLARQMVWPPVTASASRRTAA